MFRYLTKPLWALAFIALVSVNAKALSMDANVIYLSDSLTQTSGDTGVTRIYADVAMMLNLSKKGQWVAGLNYGYISAADTGSTDTSFGSTDMGIKFGCFFDRAKTWGTALTYNFISTAEYNDGSSSVQWRGTSLKAEIGVTPALGDSFNAGIKLNYFLAAFGEEVVGVSTLNTVSNSRSVIYPTIAFSWRFD